MSDLKLATTHGEVEHQKKTLYNREENENTKDLSLTLSKDFTDFLEKQGVPDKDIRVVRDYINSSEEYSQVPEMLDWLETRGYNKAQLYNNFIKYDIIRFYNEKIVKHNGVLSYYRTKQSLLVDENHENKKNKSNKNKSTEELKQEIKKMKKKIKERYKEWLHDRFIENHRGLTDIEYKDILELIENKNKEKRNETDKISKDDTESEQIDQDALEEQKKYTRDLENEIHSILCNTSAEITRNKPKVDELLKKIPYGQKFSENLFKTMWDIPELREPIIYNYTSFEIINKEEIKTRFEGALNQGFKILQEKLQEYTANSMEYEDLYSNIEMLIRGFPKGMIIDKNLVKELSENPKFHNVLARNINNLEDDDKNFLFREIESHISTILKTHEKNLNFGVNIYETCDEEQSRYITSIREAIRLYHNYYRGIDNIDNIDNIRSMINKIGQKEHFGKNTNDKSIPYLTSKLLLPQLMGKNEYYYIILHSNDYFNHHLDEGLLWHLIRENIRSIQFLPYIKGNGKDIGEIKPPIFNDIVTLIRNYKIVKNSDKEPNINKVNSYKIFEELLKSQNVKDEDIKTIMERIEYDDDYKYLPDIIQTRKELGFDIEKISPIIIKELCDSFHEKYNDNKVVKREVSNKESNGNIYRRTLDCIRRYPERYSMKKIKKNLERIIEFYYKELVDKEKK